MNLQFSTVAEREIEEAADYYENKEAGLGLRFLNELSRSLELILQFPGAWSPLSKRSRRCVMRRFPYQIIYSVQQDVVTVVTVVDQHRDPERWQTIIRDL